MTFKEKGWKGGKVGSYVLGPPLPFQKPTASNCVVLSESLEVFPDVTVLNWSIGSDWPT